MNIKLFAKSLKGYLRSRRTVIIYFIVCSLIFFVVFDLYSAELDAVLYATLLSVSAAFPFAAYGLYRYFTLYKALSGLNGGTLHDLRGFPEQYDPLFINYSRIIEELFEDRKRIQSGYEASRSEINDYYSLWVHQIKTPISAMRLLLQSEESSGKAALLLELFKIEQYVEMVLQYLRAESPSTDFVLQEYRLDDIIRQAIRKYAAVFIGKKIVLDFKETGCTVTTDDKWLVFVIEQLLSNALKYTRCGKISIYMRPDAEKTLVISDTGIGIQAQDLPRVFEKGFTGFNGRMDKKSTGIGLYLCKKILGKLSHEISITSETGKGTKVYIDFSSGGETIVT